MTTQWTRPSGRPPTDAEDLVLRIAELETLVRNIEGRCATVAARASVREKATLEAEELQRQQVEGANRREVRLRSQLEAWRERAEVLEQADAPRDVLEAAHELRQLGCEGEDAHAVMVAAARVLSESKTANVRLQVTVQRMGGALDRVRHTIAQELAAHELAMAEPRPPVG